jgi:hypothetical protein
VSKDGEIIINSIKIIKIIYKFHYKINVVAETPEVAHGILKFHEPQFENRWNSDAEKNNLACQKDSGPTGAIPRNAEHETSCC